eukprot:GHVQ01024781.1.p1 GENE.GHVQ01024781.1~~GHVQ01024781.1.p1  ORF type:complete len:542 (-),score=91.12 GHVQ01024781.1:243-1808(-)
MADGQQKSVPPLNASEGYVVTASVGKSVSSQHSSADRANKVCVGTETGVKTVPSIPKAQHAVTTQSSSYSNRNWECKIKRNNRITDSRVSADGISKPPCLPTNMTVTKSQANKTRPNPAASRKPSSEPNISNTADELAGRRPTVGSSEHTARLETGPTTHSHKTHNPSRAPSPQSQPTHMPLSNTSGSQLSLTSLHLPTTPPSLALQRAPLCNKLRPASPPCTSDLLLHRLPQCRRNSMLSTLRTTQTPPPACSTWRVVTEGCTGKPEETAEDKYIPSNLRIPMFILQRLNVPHAQPNSSSPNTGAYPLSTAKDTDLSHERKLSGSSYTTGRNNVKLSCIRSTKHSNNRGFRATERCKEATSSGRITKTTDSNHGQKTVGMETDSEGEKIKRKVLPSSQGVCIELNQALQLHESSDKEPPLCKSTNLPNAATLEKSKARRDILQTYRIKIARDDKRDDERSPAKYHHHKQPQLRCPHAADVTARQRHDAEDSRKRLNSMMHTDTSTVKQSEAVQKKTKASD